MLISVEMVYLFLLTPLREGRPNGHLPYGYKRDISTHAPAGGATGSGGMTCMYESISTHAPAGGATHSPCL